jgi:hypothetical protein
LCYRLGHVGGLPTDWTFGKTVGGRKMSKSVFEATRCTRCNSAQFTQMRYVVCGAEKTISTEMAIDFTRETKHLYEDMVVWRFPLCDDCLKKGLDSHLESSISKLLTLLYILGFAFAVFLALALIFPEGMKIHRALVNPFELAAAGVVWASPVLALLFALAALFTGLLTWSDKKRRMKLHSDSVVEPTEYDLAFQGEAENIMIARKGSVNGCTFPVPEFSVIPGDVVEMLQVLAVGNTLRETLDRVPKEWNVHIDRLRTTA